jgi:hypothetical protein
MSTTTTTTPTTKAAASSLAKSAKFKAFALVFGITFAVMYVVCDLFSLPLFTYHPATNRVGWGWEPGRSGEGPAMYWYGWTAMCIVVSTVLGGLATLLPENVVKRIPLALVWVIPILAFLPLAYSLMPFWTK